MTTIQERANATKMLLKEKLLAFVLRRHEIGIPLSPHVNAALYAPRMAMRSIQTNAEGVVLGDWENAMNELVESGHLLIEVVGPPSRPKSILIGPKENTHF